MSTMVKLAMSEAVWEQLLVMLEKPVESAAVLLAGQAGSERELTLTVNRLVPVPEEAYLLRSARELLIASSGWMPALRSAADGGWLALFVHTHPRGSAAPSPLDEEVDAALAPSFRTRLGRDSYASVIIGGTREVPTFTGRLLRDSDDPLPILSLRSAGQRLRVQPSEDAPGDSPPPEIFDRQVLAFGVAGQRLLRSLHVGVVGAGGTGSAVLEQLTRLGIGALTMVDDDVLTDTNVTRIHGSRLGQVGIAKVKLAHEELEAIGFGTELHAVDGTLGRREVMERLRSCDLVFGCTDDHAGRAVLSRLAYWYLIPVIDMGVLITSSEGRVNGIFARVTTATPGEPCLLCRGEFDPMRAREEQYSDSEREALRREGYAQGLQDRDPAVVAYTTMVASQAVSDMLARLFGFGMQPVPAKLLLDLDQRRIRRLGGTSRDGCYCASPERWGRADTATPLGMTWAA
jgi:molybdopterin/thiamine biosynthesis adenylyltransferase/proteasome lid subunit RPN8/RPN11